jgi:hypothetical protein
MHRLAVGEPYHPTTRQWPETPHLRLTTDGCELALFFRSPTPREVAAVQRGKAKFAWIDSEHTAVLAFRFDDGVPWSDTPYTPHREHTDTPAGLPPGDGHLLVVVVLVDAATGIVRAIRAVTWPPRFAGAVRRSLDRLLAAPFSPQAADAALEALYARYPKTAELVRQRADVVCTGGTPEATAGTGPDASPEGSPP